MQVEGVMERVYDRKRLYKAWLQVRANAGAAGIDNMTVEVFAGREGELLTLIHEKLKVGTYRFKPAKRVLIPKPGSSKKRKLGIPVVMDRVVSQRIKIIGNSIVACRRHTPFFTHFSPSDQRRLLGNSNTIQGSSDRRKFESSLGRRVVLEDRSPH